MTRLFNDPAEFAEESVTGFVAAHSDIVARVPGGVIRSTKIKDHEVAVVIGGGSGHYPAYSGMVGQGLAHGAAVGNLFASPSAKQVYTVARAANRGGGIILSFGNYAGDVLHFSMACERLKAEGIRCETVPVTDDVSSAPVDQLEKRRGIAGDLTVFRTLSAAAEAGYDFDKTLELGKLANARTRSLGVAFSGCTLPGADAPLFTVDEGRMEVGMGIHGEPGISEADIPSARELAEKLVGRLLEELPEGVTSPKGQHVAVLLNGLGSVKYEELFVVYGSVTKLLEEAGVVIIEPEVGELVTSFDMAGLSLTLFWLNDTLEELWHTPALTPAYRKGSVVEAEHIAKSEIDVTDLNAFIPEATEVSREDAQCIMRVLDSIKETIDVNADMLGHVDAVAGDGDHGIGMQRGACAGVEEARKTLDRGAGAGTVLMHAADAWADRSGGTSGALWGVLLSAIASQIGHVDKISAKKVVAGISHGLKGIKHFGKANLGDKTMLDVLIPFEDSLRKEVEGGADLPIAWRKAAQVAEKAAKETANLLPKIGRARPLAQKSLGTPDAGALSMSLIINAVADVIGGRNVKPTHVDTTDAKPAHSV